METISPVDPAALPPGTEVGSWQVRAWKGRGSYGAVYRAARIGHPQAAPVALKLALHAWDERFSREVRLLARIRHPNVPRLLGHGLWKHPTRPVAFPYLVMEWMDGVPLYEWAHARNPTSREVMRLLAQVARGLEATAAVQGVHRDVKGDNVLVQPAPFRAVLVDFGAAYHRGASPLTWNLPPGTPRYRSPEAWAFTQDTSCPPSARYAFQPADDVFALGVSAYRLVTDEYPPPTDPAHPLSGCWASEGLGPRAPRELNARVAPVLDALIQRMVSVKPAQRGTAGALAEALERAADGAGPEADVPLFLEEVLALQDWSAEDVAAAAYLGHRPRYRDGALLKATAQRDAAEQAEFVRREAEAKARAEAPTEQAMPHAFPREFLQCLSVAVLGVTLMLWAGSEVRPWVSTELLPGQAGTQDAGLEDGGTVGVGDASLTVTAPLGTPVPPAIRLDMPPGPLQGQRRPPCGKGEVEIRKGCWVKIAAPPEDCEDYAYEWKGACYIPMAPSQRPATSDSP
ncbi:Protein kinase domain-containing protein [Stigmatella aurantiaca]|uniref:Protein kinase domain-containing protein n=1 Tax=Stigmatella aurantiaca TaxID=41 RepID=A0A1H7X6A7_STIAU|nr:serine/threonine-protein kinase [Stigmatella aurantiaca]SEM29392.1 Protein kinase domain-containing protein [Stigmatella aurantiaca]